MAVRVWIHLTEHHEHEHNHESLEHGHGHTSMFIVNTLMTLRGIGRSLMLIGMCMRKSDISIYITQIFIIEKLTYTRSS